MVRVGIVGCGFMGRMHANAYASLPDVAVAAVADPVGERAQKVGELTGAEILPDGHALIGRSDIDAVSVCTPTDNHAQLSIAALRSGKHVLCEKPIALTRAEAQRMIDTAQESKAELMVGMVLRFWPEYVAVKEAVDSGRYGMVRFLVCTRVSSTPTGVDGWFRNPARSGGAIVDMHIHDADFIRYLLGTPHRLSTVGYKNELGWNHSVTTYEYNGTTAVAECGWGIAPAAGFSASIRAVFENGTVMEYGTGGPPLTLFHDDTKQVVDLDKVEQTVDAGGNISTAGPYHREVSYWIECLKNGRSPQIVTGKDARDALIMVLHEIESAETGKKVRL